MSNGTTQELVLRIWSADEAIMYREQYDSELIGELVTARSNPLKERVMLRCHFDLANPNQDGPLYHLQIGGNGLQQSSQHDGGMFMDRE